MVAVSLLAERLEQQPPQHMAAVQQLAGEGLQPELGEEWPVAGAGLEQGLQRGPPVGHGEQQGAGAHDYGQVSWGGRG